MLDSQYDCWVNGFRVQCKHTSSAEKADIRNKNKTTKRRYRMDDFDILALRSANVVYLIPIGELQHPQRRGFARHSIKLADYVAYKEEWELFNVKHVDS